MLAGTTNETPYTIPNDVKPTKVSILFDSHPCEKKAARMRNNALSEMRKGDVGNVAYYILKCKRERIRLLTELLILGIAPLVSMYKTLINNEKLFSDEVLENYYWIMPILSFVLIVLSQTAAADISNCLRYQQTIWDCENFLSKELDADTLKRIKDLHHNAHDTLYDILSENKIEATLLYTDPHRPITKPILISSDQTTTEEAHVKQKLRI